jgi:hypothetical protein
MAERLQKTLTSQGPKTLVGNRGYGRFLTMDQKWTRIDPKKIAPEARFDGVFVLLPMAVFLSTRLAISYKDFWRVERAFSDLKASSKFARSFIEKRADHGPHLV